MEGVSLSAQIERARAAVPSLTYSRQHFDNNLKGNDTSNAPSSSTSHSHKRHPQSNGGASVNEVEDSYREESYQAELYQGGSYRELWLDALHPWGGGSSLAQMYGEGYGSGPDSSLAAPRVIQPAADMREPADTSSVVLCSDWMRPPHEPGLAQDEQRLPGTDSNRHSLVGQDGLPQVDFVQQSTLEETVQVQEDDSRAVSLLLARLDD